MQTKYGSFKANRALPYDRTAQLMKVFDFRIANMLRKTAKEGTPQCVTDLVLDDDWCVADDDNAITNIGHLPQKHPDCNLKMDNVHCIVPFKDISVGDRLKMDWGFHYSVYKFTGFSVHQWTEWSSGSKSTAKLLGRLHEIAHENNCPNLAGINTAMSISEQLREIKTRVKELLADAKIGNWS